MRYFIELAYNGANYHGWQVQENAHAVQAELEAKLKTLLKADIATTGCGRTDTGVHASQFFAHFDVEHAIVDTGKLIYQLNAILPKDIAVYRVFRVSDTAHARFDAISREYEYLISTRPNPFLNEYSWTFYKELRLDLMNEAAARLLQHTDFECFSKVHTQVKTFHCKLNFAEWHIKEAGVLSFKIQADRFLRNMVRAIVGTLVDIGMQKTSLVDLDRILKGKNRSDAGQSVPAKGLYLRRIEYPQEVIQGLD